MRARLVVASGLATVLATGSTALAAPPWSAPEDISAPVEQVNRTSIDFGADGVALISWAEGSNNVVGPFREPVTRFSAWFPDGHGEDYGRLPAGEHRAGGGLRQEPHRRSAGAPAREHRDTARRGSGSWRASAPPRARSLARSRRVAEYRATTASSEPALAVSANGEVAVAWFELDSRPAPPRFVEQRYRAPDRGGACRPALPTRARSGASCCRSGTPRRSRSPTGGVASFSSPTAPPAAWGPRCGLSLAARLRHGPGRPFGRQQRIGPRKEGMDLQAAAAAQRSNDPRVGEQGRRGGLAASAGGPRSAARAGRAIRRRQGARSG